MKKTTASYKIIYFLYLVLVAFLTGELVFLGNTAEFPPVLPCLFVLMSLISLLSDAAATGKLHNKLKTIEGFSLLVVLNFVIPVLLSSAFHLISVINPSVVLGTSEARRCLIAIIAYVVVASVFSVYCAYKLKRTEYTVRAGKTGKKLKIVFLSDLHIGANSTIKTYEKLVDKVNAEKPDLVLFGGDYMNGDYSEITDAQKYAEILSKIKSKNEKYGVFGNHDFEDLTFLGFRKYKINLDKYSKKLEGFLKKAEIKMLKDEKVLINDDVYLVGREDEMLNKENGHSRKSASILIPKTKKPIIVLEHEPFEFRDISKNGANLILAGHTHAGQIWPGAIASRLSNDMNYGIKKKGSCTAIVSSGVGFWGPAMRLFTKSEYVVINFEY